MPVDLSRSTVSVPSPAADELVRRLPAAADTMALGSALGAAALGGEVLLLAGPLGAGKTCLVKGLAAGLGAGAGRIVTSPTFALHQQYPGRLRLDHVDLYRLSPDEDEDGQPLPAAPEALHGVGLEDWLGAADGVCAVEWPEVFGRLRPADALVLVLEVEGDGTRTAKLRGTGRKARDWLARLDFRGKPVIMHEMKKTRP